MRRRSFRYALVGVEVDDFASFEDINENIADPRVVAYEGLVIAESIWGRLGCPGIFVPFALGYRWRPFMKL